MNSAAGFKNAFNNSSDFNRIYIHLRDHRRRAFRFDKGKRHPDGSRPNKSAVHGVQKNAVSVAVIHVKCLFTEIKKKNSDYKKTRGAARVSRNHTLYSYLLCERFADFLRDSSRPLGTCDLFQRVKSNRVSGQNALSANRR